MTSLSHADLAGATSIGNEQNYRPDIDGLRAIAVLAVILYHFKIPFFKGGFVGVDVFFVISGYLITKGILNQQYKNRFDFGDFYTRRVRRLIPALLATIASSFLAAALLFSPEDFKQMSGSTVYALAGISNFFFWMQSGYFDSASTVKPLLHTWSLSVEIQFYIIWPLILIGITRMTKNVLAATSAIFVVVAAAAYVFLQQDASGAFFLTPFRIHEFLLGALVVLVERNKMSAALKELTYLAGLFLVVAPIFLYSSDGTLFPGLAALVPVAGAALMIFAGRSAKAAWPCRSWAATKIGEISYSLYLVHWPLFVFASYFLMRELTALETITLVGITSIAAIALYSLIEKPLRKAKGSKLSGNGFALASLGCSTALIVVASSSWGQNGWEWRVPEEIRNITNINKPELEKYTWKVHNALNERAGFDVGSKKEKILIIGDSQAADVVNMLSESANANNLDIVTRVILTDCSALTLQPEEYDDFFNKVNAMTIKRPELIAPCKNRIARAANENLIKSADKIIISMFWRDFATKYNVRAVEKVASMTNAKVYVVGRKDMEKSSIDITSALGRTSGINQFASRFRNPEAEQTSTPLSQIPGTKYINMMNINCPTETSCLVLTDENKPIYFDKTHFTPEGAKYVSQSFASAIN
ncbi:acyltransferase family protein [Pseudomonas nitroreducens]|uniref:acyltransferase family protein n=1 Tax=Pseudomonas nitroreducens TaxID=46680 RepID=UPI00351D633F